MDKAGVHISLDKLPLRRIDAIDESGLERFSSDLGYEEKRESLIRRIDFAWAVPNESGFEGGEEEDSNENSTSKRAKKTTSKESSACVDNIWQWQGMVENLQVAQQELSVVLDLINTVESNVAVTVAGMTRPKQLPNETLSDYSISVATKLQSYRKLGNYYKRSAKALEQKVAREGKFYGALIRLQQNWKIKRLRGASNLAGSEIFTVDLSDTMLPDLLSVSSATVKIEHDSAGLLDVIIPQKSTHTLRFGFVGDENSRTRVKPRFDSPDESEGDDLYVRRTHSRLRKVHLSLFSEQVFEMLNFRAFNQSIGANVTSLSENYLQLSIGTETFAFVSLNSDDKEPPNGTFESSKREFPSSLRYEIYLQQLFHQILLAKPKVKSSPRGTRPDGSNLLTHFCMSLTHAIFAKKVLALLDNVVCKVPYLRLISHQTWHSRTSSWSLFIKLPRSLHHSTFAPLDANSKGLQKTEFRIKIVVTDDSIGVEAEGARNILGLFRGSARERCSVNKYTCNLANLRVLLLEQVASQVVSWLHEEAGKVGMKTSRDFMSLSFELEEGEVVSLIALVDTCQQGIGWWLAMEDGLAEEMKARFDVGNGSSEYRKFLGNLSLDALHSTLIDLVSLCGGNCTF